MELFGEGGGSSPFIARSGMVDWGAVMDIDVRKCHAEGFVDSLQGVVENVARANIRTDLRFSQGQSVHLFEVSQLIIQHLMYVQKFLIDSLRRKDEVSAKLMTKAREANAVAQHATQRMLDMEKQGNELSQTVHALSTSVERVKVSKEEEEEAQRKQDPAVNTSKEEVEGWVKEAVGGVVNQLETSVEGHVDHIADKYDQASKNITSLQQQLGTLLLAAATQQQSQQQPQHSHHSSHHEKQLDLIRQLVTQLDKKPKGDNVEVNNQSQSTEGISRILRQVLREETEKSSENSQSDAGSEAGDDRDQKEVAKLRSAVSSFHEQLRKLDPRQLESFKERKHNLRYEHVVAKSALTSALDSVVQTHHSTSDNSKSSAVASFSQRRARSEGGEKVDVFLNLQAVSLRPDLVERVLRTDIPLPLPPPPSETLSLPHLPAQQTHRTADMGSRFEATDAQSSRRSPFCGQCGAVKSRCKCGSLSPLQQQRPVAASASSHNDSGRTSRSSSGGSSNSSSSNSNSSSSSSRSPLTTQAKDDPTSFASSSGFSASGLSAARTADEPLTTYPSEDGDDSHHHWKKQSAKAAFRGGGGAGQLRASVKAVQVTPLPPPTAAAAAAAAGEGGELQRRDEAKHDTLSTGDLTAGTIDLDSLPTPAKNPLRDVNTPPPLPSPRRSQNWMHDGASNTSRAQEAEDLDKTVISSKLHDSESGVLEKSRRRWDQQRYVPMEQQQKELSEMEPAASPRPLSPPRLPPPRINKTPSPTHLSPLLAPTPPRSSSPRSAVDRAKELVSRFTFNKPASPQQSESPRNITLKNSVAPPEASPIAVNASRLSNNEDTLAKLANMNFTLNDEGASKVASGSTAEENGVSVNMTNLLDEIEAFSDTEYNF